MWDDERLSTTRVATIRPPSRTTVTRSSSQRRRGWEWMAPMACDGPHTVGQTLQVTEGVGLVVSRDGTTSRMRGRRHRVDPPDESTVRWLSLGPRCRLGCCEGSGVSLGGGPAGEQAESVVGAGPGSAL